MGAERQHKERSSRNGRNANSASGKVSIGNLVDEGLLVPGNVVVCNSWPFSAVITAEGTFDARWTPIPSTFVDNVGHEFMKAHFETPSAWATAVCRVMRAQARAQKQDREEKRAKGGSTGGSGESRVAVNGWTACRVQICKGDSNWELAQRLDSDQANREDKVIELSLDVLRRELTLRASRRTRTPASIRRMGGPKKRKSLDSSRNDFSYEMALDSRNNSGSDHNHLDDDDDDDEYDRSLAPTASEFHSNAELQEITGAVDGLAKRVESDLALGCVKQRRAAAAAADAISAASSAGLGSQTLAAPVTDYALERKRMHSSRKRKSIPDMLRHAKQSRVPTGDNSDSNEVGVEQLDAATRKQLAYFHERAEALKQTHMELKALRYQRKQQLKRRIANALDVWLHQRNALRMQQNNRLFLAANRKQSQQLQPASPVPSLATSPCSAVLAAGDASAFPLAMSLEPAANNWTLDIVGVRVPCQQLQKGMPQLCTACGSAGSSKLFACHGCGDRYHDFCISTLSSQSFLSPKLLCPACRVCAQCFMAGGSEITEDLLQCDQCGVCVHARCSAQQSVHRDGLAGIVRESGGRWKCDNCICCLECGFVMADAANGESPKTSDWQQRVCWMHDFSICGQCAQQIDRGKVCPECIATYANCRVGNSSMVCCDICQFWVHADCDPALTPSVYDALITLEDEAYVCPRCCATSHGNGMLESSQENSDTEDDPGAIVWLPRCLRSLQDSQTAEDGNDSSQATALPDIVTSSPLSLASSSTTAATALMLPPVELAKSEPETTEEAANMLLSLTQSDVRFGHDRFEPGALEQRFCSPKLLLCTGDTDDWRCCVLCGLHGDGTQAQPALGRLVPLKSSTASTEDVGQWVHVECLAWAWGPRPVVHRELSCGLPYTWTQFEGVLLDSSTGGGDDGNAELPPVCTLCGRANASFHCCAPVPCFDTAFHLPCLLLAGSPSPHLVPDCEQYSAAWRRALCASHAPMFSNMMPGDATVGSKSYTHTRVQTRLDITGLDAAGRSQPMCVVGGGLVVLDWGETTSCVRPACGLRCVRIFALGDQTYSMGISAVQDKQELAALLWCGWIQQGVPQDLTAEPVHSATAHSLAELMELLFGQQHVALNSALANVLVKRSIADPLCFLNLSRLIL
ncbi:Histone-lysine N-methyltransferase [Coemansia sp. RSA 2336]|nr:Histone-lysine N-methyltransferase [Coemansia sp. RSA 2336]